MLLIFSAKLKQEHCNLFSIDIFLVKYDSIKHFLFRYSCYLEKGNISPFEIYQYFPPCKSFLTWTSVVHGRNFSPCKE